MPRSLLLAVAFCVAMAATASAAPTGTDAWRAGLETLRRELPVRHPAPFLNVTRAAWDSAAADLERRLPSLTQNQALVGVMRLVTLLGDAHTVPEPDSALGLRFYPVELYSFDDGLFVRRAAPADASLGGAKVLRGGRAGAEEAVAAAGSVVPHENEWWVRGLAPFWLMVPEVVDGLGLAADAEALPLLLERDGRTETVTIRPAGRLADQHGRGSDPRDMNGWSAMRSGPAPLWEQRPGETFWWTFDQANGTLYACQRGVVPSPRSATNRDQWDRFFAAFDSLAPARVVIDLRENGGGNGALNRYPVQQILRRPALDRPDRLFVIIGRRTFSAAQQFANLLEAWTRATFVGEPTGQRPSQYGDHRPLVLIADKLKVQVSTVFHQAPNEFDRRASVPPRVYAPLDSKSYRRGEDPALAAALVPDPSVAVVELVQGAIAAGDTARAEQAMLAARDRPANRFVSFEGELNRVGYQLLGAGKVAQAIQVFRLNTRVYPRSANTFDSLGEALLAQGWRDAAVGAYRAALAATPGFPPSVEALRRLGAGE